MVVQEANQLEGHLRYLPSGVLRTLAEHRASYQTNAFQIGGFNVRSATVPTAYVTPTVGEWELYRIEESGDHFKKVGDPLLTLEQKHRKQLIRLTIDMIATQADHYSAEHFRHFIRIIDNEVHDGVTIRGGEMMREVLSASLPGYCAQLSSALESENESKFKLYNEYIDILKTLNPDSIERIKEETPTAHDFIMRAIKRSDYHMIHMDGVLVADWFAEIVKQLWFGDIKPDAIKSPVLHMTMKTGILGIQRRSDPLPQEQIFGEPWYIDTTTEQITGLSQTAISAVLKQSNQAVMIDIIKLFLMMMNESRRIRRDKRMSIPGGYKELTELLAQRFGTSTSPAYQTKVATACRCIDALRFAHEPGDIIPLFSIARISGQLRVVYLAGVLEPLVQSERLVPILNIPQSEGRSRATYNRFGLMLGVLFVERSDLYLSNKEQGIPLSDDAIDRLKVGIGSDRRRQVMKLLDEFTSADIIKVEDGFIRLGTENEEAHKLIIDGARVSESGRRSGRRSVKARRGRTK